MKMPFFVNLLMGFVLGTVTPTILVPCMMKLQELGNGIEKDIPITLITANSLDNIAAVFFF